MMHFVYILIMIMVLGGAAIHVIISYIKKKVIEAKNKKEKIAREEEEMEREKREEERNRKKWGDEINDLANDIVRDWNASLYPDKVETPGQETVIYKFENGDTVWFRENKLIYTTSKYKSTYTIGTLHQGEFRRIFNKIVKIINDGKTAKRKSGNYSYGQRNKFTDGGKTTYPPNKTSSQKNSDNPRQRRYDILMETIKLRKENLAKMSKNHSDRPAMEQELNVAERKAAEIKKELQKS